MKISLHVPIDDRESVKKCGIVGCSEPSVIAKDLWFYMMDVEGENATFLKLKYKIHSMKHNYD